MNYFIHISMTYATKNRLEVAVMDYLKTLDRLLIADFEAFAKEVLSQIAVINSEHPRCKPLKPSFYCYSNDWLLDLGANICTFHARAAKGGSEQDRLTMSERTRVLGELFFLVERVECAASKSFIEALIEDLKAASRIELKELVEAKREVAA